jgi:antitoxin (DNA-binding transcriptional repressor) of toxin-antitoxin stability system
MLPITTVTIKKAKTQLSRLIAKACLGEEIIIARGSKPIVRLVAMQNANGNRKPGAWKGNIRIRPEFFEPLPPDELDG